MRHQVFLLEAFRDGDGEVLGFFGALIVRETADFNAEEADEPLDAVLHLSIAVSILLDNAWTFERSGLMGSLRQPTRQILEDRMRI